MVLPFSEAVKFFKNLNVSFNLVYLFNIAYMLIACHSYYQNQKLPDFFFLQILNRVSYSLNITFTEHVITLTEYMY